MRASSLDCRLSAAPELEEVSAKESLARRSWVRVMTRAMPPVTAWQHERWDIRVIQRFEPPEENEAENSEWEETLAEFCEQSRRSTASEGNT